MSTVVSFCCCLVQHLAVIMYNSYEQIILPILLLNMEYNITANCLRAMIRCTFSQSNSSCKMGLNLAVEHICVQTPTWRLVK